WRASASAIGASHCAVTGAAGGGASMGVVLLPACRSVVLAAMPCRPSRPWCAAAMLAAMKNRTVNPSPEAIAALAAQDVRRALEEDLGNGDLTAALVPAGRRVRARVLAREAAVVCGAPWVEAALRALDPDAELHWQVEEGARCAPDQVVLELQAE